MLDGFVGLTATLVSNPRPIVLMLTSGIDWVVCKATCVDKSFAGAATIGTANTTTKAVNRKTKRPRRPLVNSNLTIPWAASVGLNDLRELFKNRLRHNMVRARIYTPSQHAGGRRPPPRSKCIE